MTAGYERWSEGQNEGQDETQVETRDGRQSEMVRRGWYHSDEMGDER